MSNTFCLYPFMNLNSNTEGSVKLCCSINENIHVKDKNGNELNFGTHSIEEIWNSEYMQTIRKQMLNGERPSACNVCWRLEDLGLNSSRKSAWAEFKDLNLDLKVLKTEQPPLPSSLELRLGNFCNLRCNSCWSLSSDRIYDERKRMLKDKTLPVWAKDEFSAEINLADKANWRWWEDDVFVSSIKQLAPTLKRLYLTGGEPTLIKQNTEIMKMILDTGNTDCYIALTTNLTNWDNDFFSTMGKFKNGEFQISIDDIGERNYYIRFPTQWQHVENNLAGIYQSFPVDWKIKHYTVLQTYNYNRIPEIIDWIKNQRRWWSKHENNRIPGMSDQHERVYIWSPIILDQPKQLNVRNIPLELRYNAAKRLEEYIGPTSEQDPNLWYQYGIDQTLSYLRATEEPDLTEWTKFFEYNDLLSKHRKINFTEYFPELAEMDPRKND